MSRFIVWSSLAMVPVAAILVLAAVAQDPPANSSASSGSVHVESGESSAVPQKVTVYRIASDVDRAIVRTAPLSLREMATRADKIFVGQVREIKLEELPLIGKHGEKGQIAVKTVTVRVQQTIKGAMRAESDLSFHVLDGLDLPMVEGEAVLLFLPKPSSSGLVAPVGVSSGLFKIDTDSDEPGFKVARNQQGNRDLWSSALPLIGDKPPAQIDPDRFQFHLGLQLSLHLGPETIGLGARIDRRRAKVLGIAQEPCRPRTLPLELVIAATKTYLERE
jgi:hypothetical protein